MFVLPFWRLIHGWASTLVFATIVLTLAVYVLQRSLVLTTRGPRLAAGARTHLLVLGALALGLKAIGFWLDRFDLVFSPRGIVFGAAYSDIYASLPVLGALAVFAALCGVACLAQIARSGLRLVAGGLIALTLVWVLGLGIYPALLQRFMPAQPYFAESAFTEFLVQDPFRVWDHLTQRRTPSWHLFLPGR